MDDSSIDKELSLSKHDTLRRLFELTSAAIEMEVESRRLDGLNRQVLREYGLTEAQCTEFLGILRPLVDSPLFKRYLTGVLEDCMVGWFATIDGLSAVVPPNFHGFHIAHETGGVIDENLCFEFGVHLSERREALRRASDQASPPR